MTHELGGSDVARQSLLSASPLFPSGEGWGDGATTEALPEAEQERLAEILDAYLVAIERGAPVSPQQLLAEHPAEAEYLRLYLSGLELFHAAAASEEAREPAAARPQCVAAPRGQMIGEFEIVGEIGRGGMGVVYEALQPALRRRVALKVLPRTAASDVKQLGRFKNEAQAAAQVQHPNIVPVFAVGEAAGVHYFAMQLIEGASLAAVIGAAATPARAAENVTTLRNVTRTRAIESTPSHRTFALAVDASEGAASRAVLDLGAGAERARAVARLAVQAAEALHAAHEYGVIHRDVKPSNLLVDLQGKLWVADFGLARFRDGAELTQTGDVCGTMRYMSPEQALGRASLVDHRTDVYSLGVTLYELATLHHPSDGAGALRRFFDSSGLVSKPLRHWDSNIPKDFETIVMKATADFACDRYGTAQELADDLRRFLAGEAIRAVPPSRWTCMSKWAVRHKRAVGMAACIAAIAVVAASAASSYLAGAKASRDQAMAEASGNFDLLGKLLYDVPLSTAEQLAAIPGTERVRRQLLEQSLSYYVQLSQRSFGDPALGGELALAYSKIGGLSAMIGDHDKALRSHRDAREILEGLVAQQPENVEYARNLALCCNNGGLVLLESGRAAEALVEFHAARLRQEHLRSQLPNDAAIASELATTYSNLGLAERAVGDVDAAAEWFRTAIVLGRELRASAPENAKLARALAAAYNNLGSLDEARDATAAVRAYEQAVEIQGALVARHPGNLLYQAELARCENNLGYASSLQSDWTRAQRAYAEAARLQIALVEQSPLAVSYRGDLAVTYNNLGMALSHIGRQDEAAQAFERALAQQRPLLAARPDDAGTLSAMGGVHNNLGMLWDQRGRRGDAADAYRQAINCQRRALAIRGDDAAVRELLSKHYFNYAKNLREQGQFAAAVDTVLERRALWTGDAERLLAVARELAEILQGLPREGEDAAPLKSRIITAASATLRDAVAAGLPAGQLADPSLAAFGDAAALLSQPTT